MPRFVRLIPVVLFLALQSVSPALAQSRSAAGTREAGNLVVTDLGNLYYLGSFSSVQDLVAPSEVCGAFGLTGASPIQLSEYNGKASLSRCEVVADAVLGHRDLDPDERLL